jgi:tetratricopeptide (TPR) repeat protein
MSRGATAAVCAALAAAVAALYWPAVGFNFVSLDDPVYVFDNPPVRAGLSWAGVQWACTTLHASNWHPLTWLSLMLDATLFGPGPSGFHAVNVALHACNTVLLFLVLRAEPWPAVLAAALFGLHPLRVESVAWVAERKDVLSGLFWMLSLLAYARYARRPSARRYAAVAGAFAAGLLAKPMLVSLPLVLLLFDVWPLGRWRAAAGAPARRALLLEKLPLLAIAGVVALMTLRAQASQGAVATLGAVPLGLRVANAVVSYGAYLGKALWPVGLSVHYPHAAFLGAGAAQRLLWRAWLSAPLLVAMTLAALALRRRAPYVAVGWGWYLATLVPVIGLVQAGQQAMADRYTYLPLIGIAIIVAWGLRDLARWQPQLRGPVVAVAAAALIACAVTTRRQLAVWHDSIALLSHAVAVEPDSYFAEANLAAVHMQLGQIEQAEAHYRAALAVVPTYATALTGLGSVRFAQGDFAAAADLQRRALQDDPRSPAIYANLGGALIRLGDLPAAADALQHAVALDPSYAMAYANLGTLYLQQNRPTDAAAQLERAVALGPDTAARRNLLGLAYARSGRWSDAAANFAAALRLQPDVAEAQRNLAAVQGRDAR